MFKTMRLYVCIFCYLLYRYSIGDCSVPFCLQSCAKPLGYAMAVNDLGSKVIHQYVGLEPSGQAFNSLILDSANKPHNPMINAGAVIIASLLKADLSLPDKFDYVRLNTFTSLIL